MLIPDEKMVCKFVYTKIEPKHLTTLKKKKTKLKKTSEFATKHSNLLYSLNSTLRAGKGENIA